MTKLRKLELSKNRLTSLPSEIGELTELQELDLGSNELATLPSEIGQLVNLKKLSLFKNELLSLPDRIGNLSQLQNLNLSYNKLDALPVQLGELRKLESLNLECNVLLSELPIALGSNPALLWIGALSTSIPEGSRQAILNQCKALRSENAAFTFEPRLKTWVAASREKTDLSGLKEFEQTELEMINEWVLRLEKTPDFRKAQVQLAQVACGMLLFTTQNKEFKEMFLAQVRDNLEDCEDRAGMAFNELYLSWCLAKLNPNGPMEEKVQLVMRAAKTLALRQRLTILIDKHEKASGQILRESTETFLYYEIQLRKIEFAHRYRAHVLSGGWETRLD